MLQIFDGLTQFNNQQQPHEHTLSPPNSSGNNNIIHGLCLLLRRDSSTIPALLQTELYTLACESLSRYLRGPRVDSAISRENIWHSSNLITRIIVESQNFTLCLSRLLDMPMMTLQTSGTGAGAGGTDSERMLAAVVTCLGTFAEHHLSCLELVLGLECRVKIIQLIHTCCLPQLQSQSQSSHLPSCGVELTRALVGTLAVLCGYSHTFISPTVNAAATSDARGGYGGAGKTETHPLVSFFFNYSLMIVVLLLLLCCNCCSCTALSIRGQLADTDELCARGSVPERRRAVRVSVCVPRPAAAAAAGRGCGG